VDAPGQSLGLNQWHQGGAAPGRELLAVGEAGCRQGLMHLGTQHHRGCKYRAEQTAAPHLIDTRHPLGSWGVVGEREGELIARPGHRKAPDSDGSRGAAAAAARGTVVVDGLFGFRGRGFRHRFRGGLS